jgi:putative DNA-invertase from lambdoid prophage Rac
MQAYIMHRQWTCVAQGADVGSGVQPLPQREGLLRAARQRALEVILVWRLDRWGRSLSDLVGTLQALSGLGVGFVSVTEVVDLTTPTGRALEAISFT